VLIHVKRGRSAWGRGMGRAAEVLPQLGKPHWRGAARRGAGDPNACRLLLLCPLFSILSLSATGESFVETEQVVFGISCATVIYPHHESNSGSHM